MSEAELKTLSRREALGMLSAAGAILSAACSADTPTVAGSTTSGYAATFTVGVAV